jgi:hypothetical protein
MLVALAAALDGRTCLISVGGIDSAEEAYRRIRAGANLVQVYTGLIYEGPGLVRRRLGITPAGLEVPVEYGGKLSGRVGRFDLGALSIRQDASDTIDALTATVARAAANILEESSVGIIATSGDPARNFDNSSVGFDFRYANTRLPGNRSLDADVWYQQSDSADLQGDDSAAGFSIRVPNNTGLRGGLGRKRIERNFNPALGYVNNAGIDDTTELALTAEKRGTIHVCTMNAAKSNAAKSSGAAIASRSGGRRRMRARPIPATTVGIRPRSAPSDAAPTTLRSDTGRNSP